MYKDNLIIISYTAHGDYHSYMGLFRFLLKYYKFIYLVIDDIHTPLLIIKDLLKDKINHFNFYNKYDIIKINLDSNTTDILNLSIPLCKHGVWNTRRIYKEPIEYYKKKGCKYYNDSSFAKTLNLDKEHSDFSGYDMSYIENVKFYKNIGFNPDIVFKYYYYQRNIEKEQELYLDILNKYKLDISNPKYNIICEYSHRNSNYVMNKNNIKNNYTNINIHKICDNPILLLTLFINSTEMHLMENSIALFLYYLQKSNTFKLNKQLNIHLYMRKRAENCVNMLRNPILENWKFI